MLKRMMLVMIAAVLLSGSAGCDNRPKTENKDADIIREAVARKLGKKPQDLATGDYERITELDLSNTQLSNIEPLKMLSNLQKLDLSGTQASNIESLKGLSNLKELDLHGTQVSKQQVDEPKQALPELTIFR
jgi:Leucine-rich repeat (LRR) protein